MSDIIDCVPGVCKNDGQCEELVDGFNCNCLPGYTGDTCNTS